MTLITARAVSYEFHKCQTYILAFMTNGPGGDFLRDTDEIT